MNEPTTPLDHADVPELPEPWAPGPGGQAGGPAPGRPGCGLPAFAGCGCLAVAAGILLVFLLAASPRVVEWFLDQSEAEITSALPDDVTDEQRRRLADCFDGFRLGLREGTLRTQGLTQLQRELTNAYVRAEEGALEAIDVERLIDAFARVLPAEEDGPTPAPEADPRLPVAVIRPAPGAATR